MKKECTGSCQMTGMKWAVASMIIASSFVVAAIISTS